MPKLNLTIPEEQRNRLTQAVITLLTVLLGIALTLGTQVIDQVINPAAPDDQMQALGTTHFTAIQAEDLTLTDDLTFGPNDRYPLAYASNDTAIYCAQGTFTGTLAIPVGTHSVTTPTAVLSSLVTAPGATAGDPFTSYSVRSGSTVTITVAQDSGDTATSVAIVDYCIIGSD